MSYNPLTDSPPPTPAHRRAYGNFIRTVTNGRDEAGYQQQYDQFLESIGAAPRQMTFRERFTRFLRSDEGRHPTNRRSFTEGLQRMLKSHAGVNWHPDYVGFIQGIQNFQE